MFKIKRSRADHYFSLLVRDKAGWKCERCFVWYQPPAMGLHCSHFYGRGGKSTRFDFDNAAALCFSCHQYFTANPAEHRDFFYKRLGEKRYNDLVLRAHTPTKIDEKLILIGLKKEAKALGL